MVIPWAAFVALCLLPGSPAEVIAGPPEGSVGDSAPMATSPDLVVEIGAFLEHHWSPRPEWGDMLAAIFKGEAFLDGKGWWKPSESLRGWKWLQDRFDADQDGRIVKAEMPGVEAFLDDLDRDLSGDLSESDLQVPRGGDVAAVTEIVFRRLDEDSNGRVSWDEVSWFFQKADREKRGFLTPRDLDLVLAPACEDEGEADFPSRARMLGLLLWGYLGSLREGPRLGEAAPDFELPSRDEGSKFRLSSFRGKKPVILIFGSFT